MGSCLPFICMAIVVIELLLIIFESLRLIALITDKTLLKTIYFTWIENRDQYSGQELDEIELKVDKIYTPYYTYFCGMVLVINILLTVLLIIGLAKRSPSVLKAWAKFQSIFVFFNVPCIITILIIVPSYILLLAKDVVYQSYRISTLVAVGKYKRWLQERARLNSNAYNIFNVQYEHGGSGGGYHSSTGGGYGGRSR